MLVVVFCGQSCLFLVFSLGMNRLYLELASVLWSLLCPDASNLQLDPGLAEGLETVHDEHFELVLYCYGHGYYGRRFLRRKKMCPVKGAVGRFP